ncbi:hypothetical protein [Leptothoe spongobia]|uniref:Uncharacterized protein n=1 Tax=Leptothoe spongobia TAU-MAC 1115 TaxID=1967444 RepID=A0A947DCU6_9CYAN|nr:hypothetical protein [Leptothoe spongobia]MBT9314618.1 hypothetical protein [Leptothoe spongobia TAU-MAC 1115]
MVVDRVSDSFNPRRRHQDVQQAQQTIYDFLLDIVKSWPAADVLAEFKSLFLQHHETVSTNTVPALYAILFANDKKEFHNTLKRSCYILINNWEVAREYGAIRGLIQLFADPAIHKISVSPTIKRLRQWLKSFVESDDFQDLKLFVENRFSSEDPNWSRRYTAYLLAPQYIDTSNPLEQREAARALSQRLRNQFKFDLAMYTAHFQKMSTQRGRRDNPTMLGDSALRVIRALVAKRGMFSHRNLARIFHEQTHGLSYASYKNSLVEYLLFSAVKTEFVVTLENRLRAKLNGLYLKFNQKTLDPSLALLTSNRVIDYLMTEDAETPSSLFSLLLTNGRPLTLAIVLLKLILASPNSHPYLDARIADLIRYYEQFPREECQWIINFLEIYGVTLAICGSDVQYNLVHIQQGAAENPETASLDEYRIFSQIMKEFHWAPLTQSSSDRKDAGA